MAHICARPVKIASVSECGAINFLACQGSALALEVEAAREDKNGDVCGGAWRLVGRLGVEEDAPADAGSRARILDPNPHRPRRARSSGASRCRSRHAYPGTSWRCWRAKTSTTCT